MKPETLVGPAAIATLRRAGWIVVRHDAIALAQAHAAQEARNGR